MGKSNGKETKPMLAPFVQLAPEWFDTFGSKGFWRAFGPDAIKVEEFREGGGLVVRAEAPGVDPEKDIDVMVQDDVLTIHVQRSEKKEDQEKDNYRSEFRYGSFTRVVQLPQGADADDVKASYRDGILEVRLPIDVEKAGARKVAIAH